MTTVQVRCLCGVYTNTLRIPSAFPVDTSSCSCSICRYTTGVLHVSCLALQDAPDGVDKLRSYDSSDRLTRFFCGNCGSHLFTRLAKDASWGVYSGVVDREVGPEQVSSAIERYVQHEFVGETLDGGLMICLASKQPRFFLQGPVQEPVKLDPLKRPSPFLGPQETSTSIEAAAESPNTQAQASDLRASCQCGGVQFFITRPNQTSRQCYSPWPDLLVPYHSKASSNPEDVKWWLRAGDTKYLAGTCACRSCRLACGSPIQTWAFIPKANLKKSDGSALDFSFGTLKQVESSKGCYREFCGTCGATVFWHCEERPDLIDVSVGLMRASEGARAESWLEWWTERVSFKEEALDKALVDEIERGLSVIRAPRLGHEQ